jgi:hypothetical protein
MKLRHVQDYILSDGMTQQIDAENKYGVKDKG